MAFKKCDYFSDEFSEIMHSYLSQYENPRTAAEKWNIVCMLCEYAGKDFLDLEQNDVDMFFYDMDRKVASGELSASTYQGRKSVYATLSVYIRQNYPSMDIGDLFSRRPAHQVSGNIKPDLIPSISDVDRLLDVARDDAMYYLIFSLAFRVAIATNEILHLRLQNVQKIDDSYCIHFPALRQRKERVMLLPKDVEKLLLSYIDDITAKGLIDDEGHLFYNTRGTVLSVCVMGRRISKYLRLSGLENKYTLKDLRSRSILDMVYAACSNESEMDDRMATISDYSGIRDLRLKSYISAAHLVHENPANWTNITVAVPGGV